MTTRIGRLAALAVLGITVLGMTPTAAAAPPPQGHQHAKVCAKSKPRQASCKAIVDLNVSGPLVAGQATPAGYGPGDLQSAYNLPTGQGGGKTVAIVDAYDLPSAQGDLNTYRSQYGLPPCGPGCFSKVDQNGGGAIPPVDAGWGQEIALDIDMVSAACPNCNILLVEANSPSFDDLGTAVNTAARMGAVAISNSYGGGEFSGQTGYDTQYYNHPGVAVTVSSGDSGYGVQYPAASQYVTAVGGTSLYHNGGFSESAWSGAGSGCSAYDPKPSWQHDGGCGNRTVADVSAVADPNTGVAVYDSTSNGGQSGWLVFGGTSVASPIVGATFALAGGSSTPASRPYANPGALHDVTTGSNGGCGSYLCNAQPGYDGPTGLGTPNGTGAFGHTFAVYGAIGNHYYNDLGGPGGFLGAPTTDETGTPDGIGRFNHFANDGSIYWTPNTGAWSVHGAIQDHWQATGWETGPAGYPVTDERGTPDGVGRYNHFTGGDGASIYWTPGTGAQIVHGAIRAKWASLGYETGQLGYPTSDEYGIPGGRRSNFQGGTITFNFSDGSVTIP